MLGDVDVVAAAEPVAATYRLVRPRIVVSTGLVAALSPEQLSAVLAHERAHLRGRDPLRLAVVRRLAVRRFYLPLLSGLRRRFVVGLELAADRAALERVGVAALAGALLRVLDATPPGLAAGFGEPSALPARLAQMDGESPPSMPAPRQRDWVVSRCRRACSAGRRRWFDADSGLLPTHELATTLT